MFSIYFQNTTKAIIMTETGLWYGPGIWPFPMHNMFKHKHLFYQIHNNSECSVYYHIMKEETAYKPCFHTFSRNAMALCNHITTDTHAQHTFNLGEALFDSRVSVVKMKKS